MRPVSSDDEDEVQLQEKRFMRLEETLTERDRLWEQIERTPALPAAGDGWQRHSSTCRLTNCNRKGAVGVGQRTTRHRMDAVDCRPTII